MQRLRTYKTTHSKLAVNNCENEPELHSIVKLKRLKIKNIL